MEWVEKQGFGSLVIYQAGTRAKASTFGDVSCVTEALESITEVCSMKSDAIGDVAVTGGGRGGRLKMECWKLKVIEWKRPDCDSLATSVSASTHCFYSRRYVIPTRQRYHNKQQRQRSEVTASCESKHWK